jgi:integrase
MTTESTTSRRRNKPAKPYPDFPLFPHGTGRWAKKIRGKHHYFGPWDDPDGALKRYLDQRDDLHAGRTPRNTQDGFTVRDLCNRFLTTKRHLLDAGELSPRTFGDYHNSCDRLVKAFGKNRLVDNLAADDFERLRTRLAKSYGPVALGNEIQRVRTVFKYAYDAGHLDKPVRFGPGFKKPSRKVLRQARHANGPRMFESAELRAILAAASSPLKAMVLLGINCGFGQSDIGALPISAIDFDASWVDFPRPKTSVQRRCPLWSETVQALREALDQRKAPRNRSDVEIVFVTKYGRRWSRTSANGSPIDNVGEEFAKLLRRLGLKRPKINFYAIRHTFETIGGESRDQVALDHLMGHARDDMASLYRERISDERLTAVTDTVHRWLFAPAAALPPKA